MCNLPIFIYVKYLMLVIGKIPLRPKLSANFNKIEKCFFRKLFIKLRYQVFITYFKIIKSTNKYFITILLKSFSQNPFTILL